MSTVIDSKAWVQRDAHGSDAYHIFIVRYLRDAEGNYSSERAALEGGEIVWHPYMEMQTFPPFLTLDGMLFMRGAEADELIAIVRRFIHVPDSDAEVYRWTDGS